LILWVTSARASDWLRSPRVKALDALAGEDWETYTEALAHMAYGWSEGEQSRREAAFIRECVTRQAYQALMAETRKFDVEALLSQVTCPTLVLHRREVALVGMDEARRLASGISQAYLTVFEGTSPAYYLDDAPVVLAAIDEFLGEGAEAAPERQQATPGGLQTILFTDVEGSTALTQRLGDARARELLREHERITRECLKALGGSEVKTMGDGFMASFGSATRALECAIAMQRAFEERSASLPAHPVAKGDSPGREPVEGRAKPQPSAHPFDSAQDRASTGSARADRDVGAPTEAIRVRIGLNAGEPIAEDDPDGRGDLFGTAVIAAARIAAQAEGGEILVSNVVRELVAGKGFLFSSRGRTALRGFDDPVEVYEVRWQEGD
ncbi:MAG TPA: adenylate/guanylate cyclase domain-containing protein, partial [Dehalococcoidia bacterium]|nr:adenylate/guanylate cyclase domain-containing protein [Dehalococcoidia bacterium]